MAKPGLAQDLDELLQQAVDELLDIRSRSRSDNMATEFSAGYAKGVATALAVVRKNGIAVGRNGERAQGPPKVPA